MNIEKLAKHLKEFTLDEIEMIAECDCKPELERLLNEGKVVFEQGSYKYIKDVSKLKFCVFIDRQNCVKELTIEDSIQYFLNNYAAKFCSPKTNRLYRAAFKLDILPILEKYKITEFNREDIITIYTAFEKRKFKPKRLKNTMALLKQFLKYSKTEGLIKNYTDFQVRRLTPKNEFNLERIIF